MERYYLDGKKIQKLRNKFGWTQTEFGARIKRGRRWVCFIEGNHRSCSYKTAKTIARELGVRLRSLIRTRDVDWREVPPLPLKKDTTRLHRAIVFDMNGQHRRAAEICAEILERLDAAAHPREFGAVLIKTVTFWDNARQHERALKITDHWLAEFGSRPSTMAETTLRIRYHRGICLRRLGRFDEARRELESLRDEADGALAVSVLHQLAVIEMERAKKANPKRPALGNAIRMFRECLDRWDEVLEQAPDDSHRRAYPLGRLGEAYALLGDFAKAIEYYAEALKVFSWHNCARYADDALEAIRRLTTRFGPGGRNAGRSGRPGRPGRPRRKTKRKGRRGPSRKPPSPPHQPRV